MHDDCPRCGVTDYGFEMPDTRSTYYISHCECEDKDDCGGDCDSTKIEVRIKRIWDQRCDYCEGVDWRPEWQVLKDGKVVCTVPSEASAEAVIRVEFPDAKPPEPDYAWESERWLRRAEGWG